MKRILVLFVLAILAAPAIGQAAASYSDKYTLSTDTTFQSRVRAALHTYCGTVFNEDPRTALMHTERLARCVAILGAPDSFKTLYADTVALDASVISDATAGGTVVLTGGNVQAQAALVTDAHIDAAIGAQFNFFIVPL